MRHGNVALAFAPRMHMAPPARGAEEEVVVPISERVTLMELREAMCRWPLGDPTTAEFRFCGGKSTVGGGPYCAYHARVAYQPAQDRRRGRRRSDRGAASATLWRRDPRLRRSWPKVSSKE